MMKEEEILEKQSGDALIIDKHNTQILGSPDSTPDLQLGRDLEASFWSPHAAPAFGESCHGCSKSRPQGLDP